MLFYKYILLTIEIKILFYLNNNQYYFALQAILHFRALTIYSKTLSLVRLLVCHRMRPILCHSAEAP